METRLLVGNLSNETTEENLRSMFAQIGTVKEVAIVKDGVTGSSKGFAFAYVTMNSLEEANKAIYVFNGRTLDDRELKVNIFRINDGNDDSRPSPRDQSNRSQNQSGGSKRS